MDIFRLLFASDLHGSNLVFKKLLDTAIAGNVHAVLIGGDITGKTLTPLVRRAGGVYQAEFKGGIRTAREGEELKVLQDDISNTGSYPIRLELDQYTEMQQNEKKKDERFLFEMTKRLEQWLFIAETKLKVKNIQFLPMCGNDDNWVLDKIIAASTFAQNPDYDIVLLADTFEVVGESRANMTPFNCPRDVNDEILEKSLRKKIQQLRDPQKSIFMLHTPPFNSNLDFAPELDDKLRPKYQAGNPIIHPAGSRAVRKVIEEFQPILSLHGHIHESHAFAKIGRTLCINPGSESSSGLLRCYLVTMDKASIKGYMLITR